MSTDKVFILGAGMTGLAAGMASKLPIFEAKEAPGGICSSYYIRPGDNTHLEIRPQDGEAYRFEIGGGHWIFGGDPLVSQLIQNLTPIKTYSRCSSVFLPEKALFIPYPLQHNLRFLEAKTAARALQEMAEGMMIRTDSKTMAEWLETSFGSVLCELFFNPFHEQYTAGLWSEIAPQDGYKSPVDFSLATQGALDQAFPVGYNVTFIYPKDGLDSLVRRIAQNCKIRYNKKVIKIDPKERTIYFEDGSMNCYSKLLSTLPLNRMMDITDLGVDDDSYPSTSVLVLNIGAIRGENCPIDHWIYIPRSKAGFHRVGFYSHVDELFLPVDKDSGHDLVSIYVEKAYPDKQKPTDEEIVRISKNIVQELQDWGWIRAVDVIDPTWIEVAYSWTIPGSQWKKDSLLVLEKHNIFQIGRYARWMFQGIADSIRDGLMAGAAFKEATDD